MKDTSYLVYDGVSEPNKYDLQDGVPVGSQRVLASVDGPTVLKCFEDSEGYGVLLGRREYEPIDDVTELISQLRAFADALEKLP